jgi:osmotically-inducible protein OsmY
MTITMTITEEEIRRNVEEELRWDPDIDSTDVAVNVRSGVVTLMGFVQSYGQKMQAETDAKRVGGVRAVANDIEVRLPTRDVRPDPEIARDCVTQLELDLPRSYEQLKVVVKDGWVTLDGVLPLDFQRERAEESVRSIKGVVGVKNLIDIRPEVSPADVQQKIEDALKRIAVLDASRITAEIRDDTVHLRGSVHSWAEREEAERAARAAPGVARVQNEISIDP